ncbi:MAG: hypothetical protein DWQ07_02685 [Chloroflexi bacterium]|nr:MAG: hypothetical protein DWQ07_02685 [Chloroflexota bacterium]MBL1193594.1 hypothetical protein [Chloroflexota bacterium]
MSPSILSKSLQVELNVQEIDLASDIEGEILFEIGLFREDHYPVERGWILFYCQANEYFSEIISWTSGPFSGASIFTMHDVNHNENLEIIYKTFAGGGSFCHAGLKVIGFVEGEFTEFIDDPRQVSCPAEYDLSIIGQEVRISITGSTKQGGIGQGPNREIEVVFGFPNDAEYAVVTEKLLLSTVRIHVLEDAQIAFDNGDIPLAIEHYQNAAFNLELENIASPYRSLVLPEYEDFEPFAYEYQTAFAIFRIITIASASGNVEEAFEKLAILENKKAEEEAANGFLLLARLFLDEINNGNSPQTACASVTNLIESEFSDLELYIGEWGTANIHYDNQTICPFIHNT